MVEPAGLRAAAPDPEPARDRLYVKALGGLGLLEDDEILYDDGATLTAGDGEFDPGFLAGLALGYRFLDRWALELEYTYRTNDLDSFESGAATPGDGGDFASASLMLNAFYSFDFGWRIDPYLGVGFGSATEIDIDLEGPGFSGEESFSGSSPAAQYMVGGQGELTDCLDLFVEGRYYRAFDPDMDGEGNPGNVESEYGHAALVVGVSWSF
jgi:opacity protein-like surface antigen